MLVELGIKDFAIIDSLKVSFALGLNIFTGETGAGKSIIMDALALLLGDRASNDIIREGREEAVVEALFDVSASKGKGLETVLKEAGLEFSDELIIKRVIQRAGRNKIYINGSLATLVTLTEVGRHLIDIYGQSEHQSLTRPEEHVEILDAFAGLGKLRSYMAQCHKEYAGIRKEMDSVLQGAKNHADKKDFIEFQLKELRDAMLKPGEDAELKREKDRLQNAEKIKNIASQAESALYSDAGSVTERLGSMTKALKDAALLDERLSKTVEQLQASLCQLEDAGSFLRDYSEAIEADPEGLEILGLRLDTIIKLKKKYSVATIDELLAKQASFEQELSGLANLDEKIKGLEGRLSAARAKAVQAAENLSEARKNAAKELEKKIEEELSTLGMKGSVFEVSMEAERAPDGTLRFSEKGADRVSFFISTNPGEGIKPLSRIASGGELSRIMLAMKSVSAVGRVPTLIFDEIDTGVSGAMAQVVGHKLKEVSALHQVLCITHLPQIAAFADRHFSVAKKTSDGRTVSAVKELKEETDIVEQISRMLGGLKVTDTTRSHAKELMDAALKMKIKRTRENKREVQPGK